MGALPGMYGVTQWRIPPDYTGFRIEVPGRNFGFFAYEEDPKLEGTPAENRITFEQTGAKTRELFELVYRLWSDRQNSKRQEIPVPR